MDFDLSDEQRLLQESVGQILADRYDFETRKRVLASTEGWSRDIWQQLAALGLTGLPFAEDLGGSAAGPVETMIVMEALGRALVVEPYLATVVLAGGLIAEAGNAAQHAALLPDIASGKRTFAFAQAERGSRYDLAHTTTTARQDGNGFMLDGAKSLVLNGDSADMLVVQARTRGAATDTDGIGLFVVPAAAPGVTRRGYPTQDGQRMAEIKLQGVRVEADGVLGDPAGAFPVIEHVTDAAIAALCAEAVGVMDETLKLTVEYLKTRKQFGTEIGAFQALQHRAGDMYIALEQARSMALLATMMAAEPDGPERAKAMAAAKIQIGRSGRLVGQQAIQLHGGIGMTMEMKVGHCFKRLTAIDITLGDADHHLARLASLGGLLA